MRYLKKLLEDPLITVVIVALLINIASTFLVSYAVFAIPILVIIFILRAYYVVKGEESLNQQPKHLAVLNTPTQADIRSSQRKKFVAIGFSAMNVDEICQIDHLRVDHETEILAKSREPGGSGANTIFALGKLGLRVGMIGIVANDEDGRKLLDSLKEANVDTRYVFTTDLDHEGIVCTGRTIVVSDMHGRRSIYVLPSVNENLSESHFNMKGRLEALVKYVNQAEFLHLSSFTLTRQLHLQTRLVENIAQNVQVSLSPGALYAKQGISALSALLGRSDIIFLYEDQLFDLVRPILKGEPEKLDPLKAIASVFKWKQSQGYDREMTVVVKIGKGGSFIHTGTPGRFEYSVLAKGRTNIEEIARPDPILPEQSHWQMVDSTGAGDALAAGTIFGIHVAMPLRKVANVGQIFAILVSGHPGARRGLPTLENLQSAYQQYFGTEL